MGSKIIYESPIIFTSRHSIPQGRIRGGGGGGGGGAKGAVAPPQPRNIGFFNTKMDPIPLKLGSIMKLTTKIHQKCQKLAFLLPLVLDLGRFLGVVYRMSVSAPVPPYRTVQWRSRGGGGGGGSGGWSTPFVLDTRLMLIKGIVSRYKA